jgi:hypothetical protein
VARRADHRGVQRLRARGEVAQLMQPDEVVDGVRPQPAELLQLSSELAEARRWGAGSGASVAITDGGQPLKPTAKAGSEENAFGSGGACSRARGRWTA